MPNSALIDSDHVDMLWSACSKEKDLLWELIEDFGAQMEISIADIEEMLLTGDFHSLQRSFHRLRGSAGNVGAYKAFESCGQLEEMARNRYDLSKFDKPWQSTKSLLRESHRQLKERWKTLKASSQGD